MFSVDIVVEMDSLCSDHRCMRDCLSKYHCRSITFCEPKPEETQFDDHDVGCCNSITSYLLLTILIRHVSTSIRKLTFHNKRLILVFILIQQLLVLIDFQTSLISQICHILAFDLKKNHEHQKSTAFQV